MPENAFIALVSMLAALSVLLLLIWLLAHKPVPAPAIEPRYRPVSMKDYLPLTMPIKKGAIYVGH